MNFSFVALPSAARILEICLKAEQVMVFLSSFSVIQVVCQVKNIGNQFLHTSHLFEILQVVFDKGLSGSYIYFENWRDLGVFPALDSRPESKSAPDGLQLETICSSVIALFRRMIAYSMTQIEVYYLSSFS